MMATFQQYHSIPEEDLKENGEDTECSKDTVEKCCSPKVCSRLNIWQVKIVLKFEGRQN